MDVPDNLYGGRKFNEGRLVEEDVAGSLAYGSDLIVLETQRLADLSCVADIQESLNHVVNIQLKSSALFSYTIHCHAGISY